MDGINIINRPQMGGLSLGGTHIHEGLLIN